MGGITRRGFIRSLTSAFIGTAVATKISLLPDYAPTPEKKFEDEDPIDIQDAQFMVHEDGVNNPLVERDVIGDDAYEQHSMDSALKLKREIEKDNQKIFLTGAVAGASLDPVIDSVLPKEEKPKIASFRCVFNVLATTIPTTLLSWATKKHHAIIAPTRSSDHLQSDFGVPADKAEKLANAQQTRSWIYGATGAFIGAFASDITKTALKKREACYQDPDNEQTIEPE